MLPNQRIVIAFILDNTCKAVLCDFLGHHPFSYIIFVVTHGANIVLRTFYRAQTHSALPAGKFYRVGLAVHCMNWLVADGASGIFTLALVKDYVIAAVRTLTAGHIFSFHIDNVTAGALNLLSGEKACAGLRKTSA
jgi:hypothetical protein